MLPRLTTADKRLLLAFAVALAAITPVDFALLAAFEALARHLRGDLLLLLRIWGTLWTWILIALAILLGTETGATPQAGRAGPTPARRGAAQVLLSATLGGLLAELGKLLIRRERPSELEVYVFRSFAERPWSSSGLGLPSSHTAVAFAGSLALITLFPRLRGPLLVMAIGCGLTRIISGAHFPSDVLAGALVGCIASRLAVHWLQRPASADA